jgi:hypothetical protein
VNIKFGTKFIIALCDAFWKIAQTGRFYFEKSQKGLSEREEKIGGCHLKKLVMSSFRKNQ